MLWLRACHIIAFTAWFAGLFYLPRLFVYHAETLDTISLARFKIMERRLYRYIMNPAGILTTALGIALLSANWTYYLHAPWMQIKLALVLVLWCYHGCCGHYVNSFQLEKNHRSQRFFRIFNEVPTLLLIGIVICVVIKP